jgi:excisionase family DNA binding protein
MPGSKAALPAVTVDGVQQPLTRLELAAFLKVSPRTIDNYVASRRIPYIRMGRIVRFRIADVERALNRYTVEEVRWHELLKPKRPA